MALGDRSKALAFFAIASFWAGVQLIAIRAVVLRFWLPLLPVFMAAFLRHVFSELAYV